MLISIWGGYKAIVRYYAPPILFTIIASCIVGGDTGDNKKRDKDVVCKSSRADNNAVVTP